VREQLIMNARRLFQMHLALQWRAVHNPWEEHPTAGHLAFSVLSVLDKRELLKGNLAGELERGPCWTGRESEWRCTCGTGANRHGSWAGESAIPGRFGRCFQILLTGRERENQIVSYAVHREHAALPAAVERCVKTVVVEHHHVPEPCRDGNRPGQSLPGNATITPQNHLLGTCACEYCGGCLCAYGVVPVRSKIAERPPGSVRIG
jgi:hypothetical protein